MLFHAGTHLCALELEHVVEIMRPLPVEPLADAPSFVTGICVIRGKPAPVVNTAALVGAGDHSVTRFITARADKRPEAAGSSIVFAVDSVLGVREIDQESLQDLPPLLSAMAADLVSAVGVLGAEPLLLLRSTELIPDSVAAAEAPAGQVSPVATRQPEPVPPSTEAEFANS